MTNESLVQAVDNLWGRGVDARQEAVEYLKNSNPDGVLPILRQLLKSEDLERQSSAAEAILIVDCENSVDEVLILLNSTQSWVRYHVCGLLLDYGYGSKKIIDELTRIATTDVDPGVRGMACEALGWIGNGSCIENLRLIATTDQGIDSRGHSVQDHAISALATLAGRFSGVIQSRRGCGNEYST